MEPITLAEVTPLWPGSLASDARAQAFVALANLRLIARVPSIPDRVDAGTLPRELVAGAVAEIVARALTAPDDGAQSVTDSAGPYSRSRSYAANRLWISDADLTYLLPPKSTGVSSRWGTMRVGLGSAYQHPDGPRRSYPWAKGPMPGGYSAGNMPEPDEWQLAVDVARAEFGAEVIP